MRKKTYLIAAIIFQCAIIAAVPSPKLFTRLTGKTITIKTAPVDPYDFMSGYHVILSFEISQLPEPAIPTQRIYPHGNQVLYNVLIEGEDGIWHSQGVHESFPENIPDGGLVIKGKWRGRGIEYGIEKFFIPEKGRQGIESDLRGSNQPGNQQPALADIQVDRFGNAALLRLKIEDRVYEY